MDINLILPSAAVAAIRSLNQLPMSWSLKQDRGSTEISFKWGFLENSLPSSEKKYRSFAKRQRDRQRQLEFFAKKDAQKAQISVVSSKKDVGVQNIPDTKDVAVGNNPVLMVTRETMCHPANSHDKGCQINFDSEAAMKDVSNSGAKSTSSQDHPYVGICSTNPPVQVSDKVLRQRVKNTKQEYLIQWKNCPATSNSWVLEEELDHSAQQYINANSNRIQGPKLRLPDENIYQHNLQEHHFRPYRHPMYKNRHYYREKGDRLCYFD